MKLKKRIAAFLLVATAVVTAACMTACGNDDAGNYVGTDDGNKSEIIVDEAAWKAAFDYSEFTNATITCTEYATEETKIESVIKFDGDKQSSSQDDYSVYFDLDTGYRYFQDLNGQWLCEKYVPFYSNIAQCINYLLCKSNTMAYFDERFSDFKYNTTSDKYEAEFDYLYGIFGEMRYGTDVCVEIVIKSGKISVVSMSGTLSDIVSGWETPFVWTMSIKDIGTTTVTLPTVAK